MPVDRRLVLPTACVLVLLVIGYPFYRELVKMTAKQRARTQFEQRVERLDEGGLDQSLPARRRLSGAARAASEALSMTTENVPSTAPPFELTSLRGETHTLDQHRNQWMFLNFWATWCRTCRQEMPSMQRLWERHRDRADFTMLAINVQEKRPAIRRFVNAYDLTFPVLLDPHGTVADRYHVTGIPETVIVTPDGRTIGKTIGYRLWDSPEALELWEELLPDGTGVK